ncbi:TPA: hypothetical protein ACH3X1_014806 [Trebouxia sp. C0004]
MQLAFYMHPAYRAFAVTALPLASLYKTAVSHMRKCGRPQACVQPMVQALQLYSQGKSPYDLPVAGTTPQAWWDMVQRAGAYPDLVRLGTALADAVPHAASLERIFSLMGWLHSKLRNRQSHETTTALTTIRTHWQRRTAKVIPANTLGATYTPSTSRSASCSEPASSSELAAPVPASDVIDVEAQTTATPSQQQQQQPQQQQPQPQQRVTEEFADQVMLDEEADAKVWQDLPDVDTLFDADEMESILESFYEADLSNELAPGAADFDVSCDEVEATHVFNLKDDFFDVSHQSIVLPTAIDMSLRPTSEPVCHYDAAAEVDRVLSGM